MLSPKSLSSLIDFIKTRNIKNKDMPGVLISSGHLVHSSMGQNISEHSSILKMYSVIIHPLENGYTKVREQWINSQMRQIFFVLKGNCLDNLFDLVVYYSLRVPHSIVVHLSDRIL